MKDGGIYEDGKRLGVGFNGATKRSLEIDVEKYQAYLDDSGLTRAQKDEFLRALWSIITAFVDLGFGVHPVQQACGQVEKELDPRGLADSDALKSDISLKRLFNDAPDQE